MSTSNEKDEIRTRYLAIDTSNVADVLDGLGIKNQSLAASFGLISVGGSKVAGWAYTIQGRTQSYGLEGDPEKMKACAGIEPGQVTVWSGDGIGICYFGELIAIGMKERGAAGAVLDGGIRDIKWIRDLKFPIFAQYRTPTQSISRWKVIAWQQPVRLGGATSDHVLVSPGDFILGDEDGVIVIPAPRVMEVLERAEELTRKEALIRREITDGLSLAAALAKFGHV